MRKILKRRKDHPKGAKDGPSWDPYTIDLFTGETRCDRFEECPSTKAKAPDSSGATREKPKAPTCKRQAEAASASDLDKASNLKL